MSIITDLKKEIGEIQKMIDQIQSECSHPESARKSEAGCNVGNYDPSADRYWITHRCRLCEKTWTEETP